MSNSRYDRKCTNLRVLLFKRKKLVTGQTQLKKVDKGVKNVG